MRTLRMKGFGPVVAAAMFTLIASTATAQTAAEIWATSIHACGIEIHDAATLQQVEIVTDVEVGCPVKLVRASKADGTEVVVGVDHFTREIRIIDADSRTLLATVPGSIRATSIVNGVAFENGSKVLWWTGASYTYADYRVLDIESETVSYGDVDSDARTPIRVSPDGLRGYAIPESGDTGLYPSSESIWATVATGSPRSSCGTCCCSRATRYVVWRSVVPQRPGQAGLRAGRRSSPW